MSDTTALVVSRLTIRDGAGVPLVEDVTLTLPRGGVLTLIGETGSGKSLIAQALFGLLPPDFALTGEIAIGGGPAVPAGDTRRLASFWREQIMLVPQEPSAALDPTMRVRRQVELAGVPAAAVDDALRQVDLPPAVARAYPYALSGGMAQRVLVATALGVGAPIIVADEPTKGLDGARVDQAVELLAGLAKAGRSLVVITHDRRVAEALGGQLAIVGNGRILEQGEARAVLAAPVSEAARAWLAADPARWPRCPRCCDMTRLALSAHGLAFGWPGARPLFRDLDLHLPFGAILGLTGPSGCGKSTLGDILLGLRRPLAGSVEWEGADIVADPKVIRRRRRLYQKLHQDPAGSFIPGMPIGRQLEALAQVKPDLVLARDLPPLLDRLRLSPSLLTRGPREISGGEAQRLALARILLLDPLAIVADEPTSRLDPVVQRETMMLLREFVDERRLGLVLVSHERAVLEAVADEVVVLGEPA